MHDNEYWDDVISFESLYRGMKSCCKGVRWKPSVISYEHNGLTNTYALKQRLEAGSYKPDGYREFRVYEPKERTILAPTLRDRQFQHSLCDNGLYEDICEHFIRDNYACQRGRGTDDALLRFKHQLGRHHRRHGRDGWYLKCDIRKFFASIPHDVACNALSMTVTDKRALAAACEVVNSFPGDIGVGLGSQVSQLVGLVVLNDMDHLIKERLGIRCYARYADDFVLVHESKGHLIKCRDAIGRHLAEIGLSLNEKTTLQPIRHGVRFLQWRFVMTETGRVLMLIGGRKLSKWRRRLRKVHEHESAGDAKSGATREVMRSYLNHASIGDTHKACSSLIRYYREMTGDDFFDRELSRIEKKRGAGRRGRGAQEGR